MTTNIPDTICRDEQALHDKNEVMRQQKSSAFYGSLSSICTFIAGVLTAGGIGAMGSALSGTITLAAFTTGAPLVGLIMLGTAALATTIAVGSNMLAVKTSSSAFFDQSEINAQHNARYVVQELKKEAACVQTEHAHHCRKDGKPWAQAVDDQRAVMQQLRI